jgi:hypothetical protein
MFVVDDIVHDTRKDIDRGKYESAVKVRSAPAYIWRRDVFDFLSVCDCDHVCNPRKK